MIRFAVIISIVGFLMSCSSTEEKSETSQPEEVNSEFKYYGDALTLNRAVDTKQFVTQLSGKDSLFVQVEGTIVETCAAKGCWMTVKLDDGEEMRITFKDYGFFVPKEGAEGKKVVFEGIGKREEVNIETLRHYAEDAGATQDEIAAITSPSFEYTFEATGVAIATP